MKKLTFQHISFGYPNQPLIFEDISFQLELTHTHQGHIVALMGASGSGKSTLLKLILGTLAPLSGTVVTTPQPAVISYLPQDAVLFEHLSPLQNARYFEHIAAYKSYFDADLFSQLSNKLGMDEVFKTTKSVTELSGGQRQRLSLLRALSIKPDILLLDEPTNGLDSDVKIHFLRELRRIVLEQNILAIYVTHHKAETELCADEVIYIQKNNTSQVQEAIQSEVTNFVERPPFLDAVKVFNYPNPNIIRCFIDDDSLKDEGVVKNLHFLSIKSENVSFSSQVGFDFKKVISTPIFTTLKLNNESLLTLPTIDMDKSTGSKLLLSGRLNVFDGLGKYLKTIEVLNNKIVR